MALTGEQLELPYFIPTSENVSQILSALSAAEGSQPVPLEARDFQLCRLRHSRTPWGWEGMNAHEGRYSERNFTTKADAILDAQTHLR